MKSSHRAGAAFAAVLVLGVALLLAGCGSSGAGGGSSSTTPAAAASTTPTADFAKVQACAACAGGMAPAVKGTVSVENGVQVLRVGVKHGYYSPNVFKVSADKPVTMVFSGKAQGCLAKPMIDALDKGTDFTSGTATLELGTLNAGTYVFTCAMGMNEGKIIVR